MEPVAVVLIVHNEAPTIAAEIESFSREIVEKIPGSEFIIAEDGSTDGTDEILRRLVPKFQIKLVQGKERKGYKQALLNALRSTTREWIFFSDTGGKFKPQDFWKLEPFRSQADLIIGKRTQRRDQIGRRVLTTFFNFLIRLYFEVSVHDIDCGFRLFRRQSVLRATTVPLILRELIATEITLRMLASGSRLIEVPVSYARRRGVSRGLPFKKIPPTIAHVLLSFSRLKKQLKAIALSGGTKKQADE